MLCKTSRTYVRAVKIVIEHICYDYYFFLYIYWCVCAQLMQNKIPGSDAMISIGLKYFRCLGQSG